MKEVIFDKVISYRTVACPTCGVAARELCREKVYWQRDPYPHNHSVHEARIEAWVLFLEPTSRDRVGPQTVLRNPGPRQEPTTRFHDQKVVGQEASPAARQSGAECALTGARPS